MRKKFTVKIRFDFGTDNIIYIFERECTDLDSMISYTYDWIKKYGDKFGVFTLFEVYEGIDLVSVVFNDA